jgi:hypothetical protein
MGCRHPKISGTSIVPPLFAAGAFGQLTAVAGAGAGARHTFPAAPAVPQTRPVAQPSPDAQDGRQNWPLDSCTHALPEAHVPAPEQKEVQIRPGSRHCRRR